MSTGDFDTRTGCYAWVERDGLALLAHWRARIGGRTHEGWTLPGGGMELLETPEQACVREVREESGYAVRLTGWLGVRSHWVAPEDRISAPGVALHLVQLVWTAEVTGGELTHELDGSTDEVRWVPLDQIRELSTVSLVDAAAAWAEQARREPGRATAAWPTEP